MATKFNVGDILQNLISQENTIILDILKENELYLVDREEIKRRCHFVQEAGYNKPKTLFLDEQPILQIGPLQMRAEVNNLGNVKVFWTQDIIKLTKEKK